MIIKGLVKRFKAEKSLKVEFLDQSMLEILFSVKIQIANIKNCQILSTSVDAIVQNPSHMGQAKFFFCFRAPHTSI